MTASRSAALAFGLAVLAPLAYGDSAPASPKLMPPPAPRHEQRMVDNASDLARDLAEIVVFLEQGQSYFRAFKKGTHSAEENAALLKFLESYEREREIARKEADLLQSWVKTRSDLEPTEGKLDRKD